MKKEREELSVPYDTKGNAGLRGGGAKGVSTRRTSGVSCEQLASAFITRRA